MTERKLEAAPKTLEEQFTEQFKSGRLAADPLWAYWVAVDGQTGHLGYEWADKPHRLVFDLLHHSVALEAERNRLREALELAYSRLDPFVESEAVMTKLEAVLSKEP